MGSNWATAFEPLLILEIKAIHQCFVWNGDQAVLFRVNGNEMEFVGNVEAFLEHYLRHVFKALLKGSFSFFLRMQ